MLRNYFKVITRSVYKNKLYAAINIIGLAFGFAAVILTGIYLHFELSFEKFYTNSDRIFRTTYSYDSGNGYDVHWARIPVNYINELPNEIPEIENLIRFQNSERKYIRVGENKFKPNHAYSTDNDIFNVFDLPVIAGDLSSALKEPNSVVISESIANTYFGKAEVLNESISVLGGWSSEEKQYTVTAVIRDLPSQTHLPIDMLLSFQNQEERTGWAYVYILLKEGAAIESVKSKMSQFIHKYADKSGADKIKFDFQPLKSIHLHSKLAREIVQNGDFAYIKIFIAVGVFILLVALVNYINLNSALILDRSKEIGLRKILGSANRQVITYLLTESIAYNLLSMILGILLAFAIFPYFSAITGISFILNPWILAAVLILLAFFCGLATGVFPLLSIPKNNPLDQLKSIKSISNGKAYAFKLKRILVMLQYAISILLIGSALIARDQFNFLNESNLGLAREQVLAIPGVPDGVKDDFSTFKDRLTNTPGILGVTGCMEVPSREIRDAGPVLVKGINTDTEKALTMDIQIVDFNYIDVLNIELLSGTNIPPSLSDYSLPEFTEDFTYQDYLINERRAYLINETAMKQMGWQSPEEALGQEVNWSNGAVELAFGPIVGIIKDYHQETLKNEIDPTIMVFEPIWLRTFLIKIDTEEVQETITNIKATWDNLFPKYPLEYHFLDDMYEELYKNDRVKLQLLYLLSGLAILISFIGLFGLIAFSLKTRIKEIAIRKVLGANTATLIHMITREYLVLLLIATILAVPVSYYIIDQWLQQFAYKINISNINYLWTILIIGLFIILTTGFQTIRTSFISPADTLRDE